MNERRQFPDFPRFFAALNRGNRPYPWQENVQRIVADDGWPGSICAPTGIGKTALISVWLYELARQAHEGGKRTAPMRLFFVVNRRLIVDEALRYARTLTETLSAAPTTDPVLGPVVTALRSITPPGDDRLLVASSMHGQNPDDHSWMRATGATIVSLTPAQMISRVLMRGYGVKPSTRSIHAGLAGIDRLVLFDEPHLSLPAISTLLDQEELQGRGDDLGIPIGQTVLLGATLGSSPALDRHLEARGTYEFNWDENLRDPRAAKRLDAAKTLTIASLDSLVPAKLAGAVQTHVETALERGDDRVLVVLNTVDAAQRAFIKVQQLVKGTQGAPPVLLLTSRFRQVDRPDGSLQDGPLVLVATQTIEVGVDLNFETLITEAASFDALVQRLGRLNRDGESDGARCVLLTGPRKGDRFAISATTEHLYGREQVEAALAAFEAGYSEEEEIGVSSLQLAALRDAAPGGSLDAPVPRVATLHEGIIPILAQTAPESPSKIPVQAYVSGPDVDATREVEVAWRAELSPLSSEPTQAPATVTHGEYVSVPIGALRGFLLGKRFLDVNDLPDEDRSQETRGELPNHLRALIRRQEGHEWQPVARAQDIAPGDRVVLDVTLGGYDDDLGWNPPSKKPVLTRVWAGLKRELSKDWAFRAYRNPGHYQVAVTTSFAQELGADSEAETIIHRLLSACHDYNALAATSDPAALVAIEDEIVDLANVLLARLCALVSEGDEVTFSPVERENILAGVSSWGLMLTVGVAEMTETTDEPIVVSLGDHHQQVGTWAGEAARRAGLDEVLVETERFAGRTHDLGKTNPRMQAFFSGAALREMEGTPAEGNERLFLAKTHPQAASISDRERYRRARMRGMERHEALSVVLAALVSGGVVETALALHLIGSHHGWFRPLFLPRAYLSEASSLSSSDEAKSLGVGHADEFLRLNQRFGPWGLAYLEAVLRLSDWAASASPQPTSDNGTRAAGRSGLGDLEARPLQDLSVGRRGSTFEEETESAPLHELDGLVAYPMASWYAAVGLLAAAEHLGDRDARLQWRRRSTMAAVAPTLPVLHSSLDLRSIVEHIFGSPWWTQTEKALKDAGCVPYGVKGQKMRPASRLREVLLRAQDEGNQLVLGTVVDSVAADPKEAIPLAIPASANNTSYPALALNVIDSPDGVDVVLRALKDVNAGYSVHKADGGLDRGRGFGPRVTGREGTEERLVRTALTPLILYGMASLGTVPPHGIGTFKRRFLLPLSENPTSLAQTRAWTLAGAQAPGSDWSALGCEWVLYGAHLSWSRMTSWSGRAVKRSEIAWESERLRREDENLRE